MTVVLAGTTAGTAIGLAHHSGVTLAPSVARAFVQANEVLENLGTPRPQGRNDATWMLSGDPLRPGSPSVLAEPERAWVGPSGEARPLGPTEVAELVRDQTAAIAAVFAGRARADVTSELRTLLRGERRAVPVPASPGGAQVVTWYDMTVRGARASVDARVRIWERHDTLLPSGHGFRLTASLQQNEIEAKATLLRRGGTWRVVAFDARPWQEAT